MHGHRRWSCMSTLLHLHVTCVWGDIPIGFGTRVRTFKLSSEAFQAVGECTNHLHHVHHFEITISTFWWLNNPSPLVIPWSSWPLITSIPHCSQLMTIWSDVPLKSAVMTHMIRSITSLWSWTRYCSGFRPDHRLISGLVQHSLVSHILLLLINRGNCNWFFSLHKLYFFGDIHSWTTFSGVT